MGFFLGGIFGFHMHRSYILDWPAILSRVRGNTVIEGNEEGNVVCCRGVVFLLGCCIK